MPTIEEMIADLQGLYISLGALRLEHLALASSIYTRQKTKTDASYVKGEQARHVMVMTTTAIQIVEASIDKVEAQLLRAYLEANHTISDEDLETAYLATCEDPEVKYGAYER